MAKDRAEIVVASVRELSRIVEKIATVAAIYGGSLKEQPQQDQIAQLELRTEAELALSRRRIEQARLERELKLSYMRDVLTSAEGFMKTLYTITGSHHKRLFTLLKGFNIAQALMDAYTAFNRTLATLPYPANLAAAATVLAQGLARVQQIRAAKPSGATGSVGGGGTVGHSYRGGSYSAYPPPQRAETAPRITIQIQGPITGTEEEWERLAEERIAPALRRVFERNVRID